MNDVMHAVGKVWYRLYWGVILLFSAAISGGYMASRYLPGMHHLASMYGLTTTIGVLATLSVVYCASLYWYLQKNNPALAMFGASLGLTLVLLGGLTVTHGTTGQWLYVGGYLASVFFAGMYGVSMLLGAVLLAVVIVLMDNSFVWMAPSRQEVVLLVGSAVLAVVGYFFWRNKSVDQADSQLSKLTGMLKTKDEQSAILIQSIADGVIVTDNDGKITLTNRAAANMTGWSVEEATGIDIQLVFKASKEDGKEIPPEEFPFKAVLVHKAFYNQVLQLSSRDGKKKQVISLVISPVVTSTGEVFGAVAVLRDISEQRAAEQQRGEFISTASHEMRTPVAAIEGYLSLALNEKVSSIDSRARNYLEKAHSPTQHLCQLFQDLLTSAKAEDGRLSNHPAVVEMGSYLEQLVDDLKFGAQKKGLATEFAVGSNEAVDAIDATKDSNGPRVVKPLYYVYVDADRMREVITNLFDNAVKYSDTGKISVGLTGNNDVVQLYIRDTGNGIPAEDVPHLFQKFYRVDNSATRTIGGTGLGLFICRKIVELYQGRIWVESELGKGSTFFINLPRVDSQKAQQLTAAAANAPPAPVPSAPSTTVTGAPGAAKP